MLKSFQSIVKIPELRRKLLFTLAILAVYRIGGHVPTPGIDSKALGEYFASAQNTLFGLYDMFVGGAFKKATIFALGIMPYISASIIFQLLGSVIPYFQKLQKEGEEGRKKITQYTRYATVLLAAMQSYGVSVFLVNLRSPSGVPVVPAPGWGFRLLTMITITSGTIFIMWLGEQITEHGIGNGISLIIFVGIIARLPNAIMVEVKQLMAGNRQIIPEVLLFVVMVLVVAAVVFITQGQRKIPVQYAKRVVGRKVYGGQSTHIPLRVNTAGVIPIIFAQAIMFLPSTIATFFQQSETIQNMAAYFSYQSPIYWFFYGLIIVFFTYFYTAVIFNPVDLADNMKKYGGFIPGIRPGKRTSDYIDNILTRITLPGAIFLAFIAVMPAMVIRFSDAAFGMSVSRSFSQFFGGTGLLIVVGVALDTLQQVESHLLMRHYDGFLKKGKLRGRR
ncbi:MAG: preprotein translocase subunit SecY [Candidatus Latescibacteria bacterium]|nr:preprotein translocase subunit SecY [Candidatus Latescibacterota bacterium]OPX24577.1 MAG: preprotein translocase subunit SecY [Candidatus Latescibacteria bacterium 4484_107]